MSSRHDTTRFLRSVALWLGDRLPEPVGSWLLRISDDSVEPWTDAEGRIYRG